MPRVQQIYADNPGAIANAVYELPPGLDLELSAIRARVNGAAAAGDFIVVAELLTQDDKILAQSPIDQTLAAGDTGALSWAPFLRGAGAGSTPPATDAIAFCILTATELAVGGFRTVTWDSFRRDDATVFTTAAAQFGATTDAAGNSWLRLNSPGLYTIRANVEWNTPAVGQLINFTTSVYGPLAPSEFSGDATLTDAANEGHCNTTELLETTSGGGADWIAVNLNSGGGSDADVELVVWYFPAAATSVVF